MAPSRTVGGPSQSSANSGLFYQGDSPSQSVINSYLSSSFGNSGNSISGTGNSNIGSGSGNVILNSVSNSGPSVGASSLVTDANSGFSGGPLLQRSASINTDSYTRLPASPMSFTSNNISVSGLSGIDGPTGVQPGSHSDPNSHQLQQGVSGSSPFPTSQTGQYPLNVGPRINNSFIQDPVNLSHLQKKPRLDIEQEDIMQQQVLHELFQRQDSMQLQSANPQLQAIYQQQILLQQQPVFQSMSPVQRLQLLQRQQQYQQQQQLRNQQSMQQMAAMKNPSDTGGVCARRLMQYLYHQRQRPAENTIAYWRKFVAEYYAPRAKKRWCLSLYDNFGQHALGVFPPASMDAWHCDICGSKSGRGFEATYEVLPRLNEIEFGSGVVDELLFVDLPRERRFANGIMMLEYGKAIQESIYEQLRVVREGQLRIIFTHELKILSWDFCARRHEELLPRRLVAPQVNQPLQVAQKCQSTLSDSGPEGVSSEDLQTNSNMVIAAGRQLAKSLELPAINDLGFSKRYVRCLQIAEVVNSMKDLVDFCQDCKVGPIDGLKSYPRHNPTPWLPTQRTHEFEQPANIQGLPTDRNTINKLLAMQSGMSNANTSSNHNILANNRAALGGSAAAALSVTNYHNIMRHNSFNSSPNSLHQEAPSSFQGSPGSLSDSRQNSVFSNSQLQGGHRGQHQQPLRSLSSNGPLQGPLLAQVNQQPTQSPSSEQHMIQQLMQGAASNINPSGPQKSFIAQNLNSGTPSSGLMQGNDAMSANNVPGGRGPTLSKSESFRGPSNSESSAIGGGSISDCNQSAPKIPQNLYLTDDMVPDLPHDFADSDCFWE